MSLREDFLWGGATAANQYEGGYDQDGKGLNAIDVMTNGSHTPHQDKLPGKKQMAKPVRHHLFGASHLHFQKMPSQRF